MAKNKVQVTYPVEVGIFGYFRFGGKKLVETWVALEDLCLEYCGGMWIGVYSKYNVLDWAKQRNVALLTTEEIEMFEKAM